MKSVEYQEQSHAKPDFHPRTLGGEADLGFELRDYSRESRADFLASIRDRYARQHPDYLSVDLASFRAK